MCAIIIIILHAGGRFDDIKLTWRLTIHFFVDYLSKFVKALESLEHGPNGRSANAASMGAVHLHDSQAESMNSGAAARISRAPPPYLTASCASVKTESVSAHFNSRFPSLTQAVAELSRETRERERQSKSGSRFCRRHCSCNWTRTVKINI